MQGLWEYNDCGIYSIINISAPVLSPFLHIVTSHCQDSGTAILQFHKNCTFKPVTGIVLQISVWAKISFSKYQSTCTSSLSAVKSNWITIWIVLGSLSDTQLLIFLRQTWSMIDLIVLLALMCVWGFINLHFIPSGIPKLSSDRSVNLSAQLECKTLIPGTPQRCCCITNLSLTPQQMLNTVCVHVLCMCVW